MEQPLLLNSTNIPEWKKNPLIYRLLGGNLISYVGDQIYLVAFPLILLAITGSPMSMGLVTAVERIPNFFLPFCGPIADRYNRKWLMIFCDLGRSILVGGIGILYIINHLEMYYVYVAALLMGILSHLYSTAQFAAIPTMVRRSDLQIVNSIEESIYNTAILIGPALGGLIISLYHPGYALLVNSFSFLLSFLAIASMQIPQHKIMKTKDKSLVREYIKDLKEGFHFVFHSQPIWITNLALLTSSFGTTIFLTLFIIHLKINAHFNAGQIGLFLLLGGISAIFASVLTTKLRGWVTYHTLLIFSFMSGGLSFMLFSYAKSFWMLVIANMLGTVMAAFINTSIRTIRQNRTPEKLMGRVQSTSRFMTWIFMPIAALLAGILAEWWGISVTLLFSGFFGIIASLIIVIFGKGIRNI